MSYKSGLRFYTSSFHHGQMSHKTKFNLHMTYCRWYCGLDVPNVGLFIFLKSKFTRPPCCSYVSLRLRPFIVFKMLADFHKIWHEYDTSVGHPYPHTEIYLKRWPSRKQEIVDYKRHYRHTKHLGIPKLCMVLYFEKVCKYLGLWMVVTKMS